MNPGLPAVSFVCAVLVILVTPAHWESRSIPILSLIAWLFMSNVFQGIDGSLWIANSEVKLTIWCDIVTKLLFGSRIAIPAICLCLTLRSWRIFPAVYASERRRVLSFECILCFLLPMFYMALHIIVQDHRFDIYEGFGCTASVYRSIPAIFLVWLPPLILCIIAVLVSCIIVYLRSHNSRAVLDIAYRNSAGTYIFLRPLFISFPIVSLVLSSTAFSIYAAIVSPSGLLRWTSWDQVHARFTTVNVIADIHDTDLVDTEFTWWLIPASTFVLIVVSLAGFISSARQDTLSGYRAVAQQFSTIALRRDWRRQSFELPMDRRPHVLLKSPEPSDLADPEKAHHSNVTQKPRKSRPFPISVTLSAGASVSPPVSTASDEVDDLFARSARTYLGSPVAREAFGYVSHPFAVPAQSTSSLPTNVPVVWYGEPEPPQRAHAASNRHSILSQQWPRPPSGIPTSPLPSVTVLPPTLIPDRHISRPASTASLSTSVVSSTINTSAHALDPAQVLHDSPTLPSFAPFSDAVISEHEARQGHERGLSVPIPKHSRRTRSMGRLITRNLSLSSRDQQRSRQQEEGAIYMTVVQETL
ncbi:STE3-domain-containing protein [Laetiporus sulphureus 93-53]|uniref:STE3-domain-containing protein n=1 Tax=Laetiporus sulphureus 93-53 TaxID=1314785 RepID=A0A165B4Z9_9APHY|nr:STE3-domain-containing protein [Laetiporus sulphureus 93-53]KZT00250.1 STE3-domain-containing protein [Laetiporus sulphureus 93-53]